MNKDRLPSAADALVRAVLAQHWDLKVPGAKEMSAIWQGPLGLSEHHIQQPVSDGVKSVTLGYLIGVDDQQTILCIRAEFIDLGLVLGGFRDGWRAARLTLECERFEEPVVLDALLLMKLPTNWLLCPVLPKWKWPGQVNVLFDTRSQMTRSSYRIGLQDAPAQLEAGQFRVGVRKFDCFDTFILAMQSAKALAGKVHSTLNMRRVHGTGGLSDSQFLESEDGAGQIKAIDRAMLAA